MFWEVEHPELLSIYLVFEEHFSKVEVFNKSMKTHFCEVKIREDTRRGCYLLGFTAKKEGGC